MNKSHEGRAASADDTFEELSAAIESGAGLPSVARAASKLLSAEEKTRTLELRVADNPVGELRWRPRGEDEPGPALLRMVTTLLGLELERSRSPEWASEEAEVVAIVPTDEAARLDRAAESLASELEQGLPGFAVTVSQSRHAGDPV